MQKISREIHYFLNMFLPFFGDVYSKFSFETGFLSNRGTKIGNHVDIAPGVFLEDLFPEFITIQDNVDLGPYVIIVTHDSSGKCISSEDITGQKQ